MSSISKLANKKRAEMARRRTAQDIIPNFESTGINYLQLTESERKDQILLSRLWYKTRPKDAWDEIDLSSDAELNIWLEKEFPIIAPDYPVISMINHIRSPFYKLQMHTWMDDFGRLVRSLKGVCIFCQHTGKAGYIDPLDNEGFDVGLAFGELNYFPDDD